MRLAPWIHGDRAGPAAGKLAARSERSLLNKEYRSVSAPAPSTPESRLAYLAQALSLALATNSHTSIWFPTSKNSDFCLPFKTQKTILDSNSQTSADWSECTTRGRDLGLLRSTDAPHPTPPPAPRSRPPPVVLCAWPLKTTTFVNSALGPVTQPDRVLQ